MKEEEIVLEGIIVHIWHCDKDMASMTSPDQTIECASQQEATLAIAEAKGNGGYAERMKEKR